ncbi:hypothetical protein [Tenacibaculum jejuense]|uniref:Uncharacterized protein n=1 Tax=Tenacibaculum jejuense TaxID=584609 RepID=A0A238U5U4_9FLAO|nr:hypothetical protein [Tenacibaculum jejuense]SNR14376.1 protein of unknown function precursor [Tenacibaculum jejuense]
MKKVLFLGVILAFTLTSSATKKEKEKFGRQCCTKTQYMSDGSSVAITACAGWFLSNNARALNRACAKVDEAMGVK